MLLHVTSMRLAGIIVVLAACRAGFDPLPLEDEPSPHATPGAILDDPTLYDGLVLWYELDAITNRTTLDASGNELHGRCHTNCPTVMADSEATSFAAGLSFDTPILPALDRYTISVSLSVGAASSCLMRELATPTSWQLCVSQTEVKFNTGAHDFEVGLGQPLGTWAHVVIVWDGAKKWLYVDGVERASAQASGTKPPKQLSVGNAAGAIDDLRIYSRALNYQDVNALYVPVL